MPLVFYSDKDSEKLLPIRAAGCGMDCDCPAVTRPFSSVPQLIFTVKGDGIISVGEEDFDLPEGCVFFLGKGAEYHYKPVAGEWIVDWLEFDYSPAMENGALFLSKKFVIIKPSDGSIGMYRDVLRGICSDLSRDDAASEYESSAKVYALIMRLSCELLSVPAVRHKINPTAEAVISYINENYMNDITLADLCEASGGISEQYLCRLFKQTTGMRPIEYILKKRIGIARSLLERTDMPIADVVMKSGFNNISYFYRNFKKFTGKSPIAYRHSVMGVDHSGEET